VKPSRIGLPLFLAGVAALAQESRDWPTHGGDPGHSQYSALDQINVANVSRLRVEWTYHTGDARADGRSEIQCHPIVVRGVLYATSPQLKAFALDAGTGRPMWTFDPFGGAADPQAIGVNRGVAYWEDGADRRILYTAGDKLFALDAGTGRPLAGFGSAGSVSLKDGLGRDASSLYILSTTPGAVYRDLLILGSRVGEGPGPAAPGHIRAYDVRTGKIRWTFHTIPWPGEHGHDTWPADAWTRVGGANAWSGISVDLERGLVFVPTGSAAFDFWGGDRKGANLFANSLLALKAESGERVWHYQLVHHDIWDRDLPAAPVLATVTRDGSAIPAVAQVTKSGHVFVFDRRTGAPLHPIEEIPVPASDLQGESAWPTQPLPLKPPPFARQSFTEADATDVSPEARAAVLARLRRLRTGRQFIPPSLDGTIIFPGFDGGAEWGGAAFDPATERLYVNANEMPWILTMVDIVSTSPGAGLYRRHCVACHGVDPRKPAPSGTAAPLVGLRARFSPAALTRFIAEGRGTMPSFAFLQEPERQAIMAYLLATEPQPAPLRNAEVQETPYTHTGYVRFLDPSGYPAVKPPWGTLNAIDLARGEIAFSVPLGEVPELIQRGLPPTGTENYGGPIVTAGGLVFIGASKDEKFRAFDKKTGRVLWQASLPAGGYATPSTYAVAGRQYVVIAAGGGKMGTRSGDAYVAFALPK
jgi:quinoprotein glucose dehydrogenase